MDVCTPVVESSWVVATFESGVGRRLIANRRRLTANFQFIFLGPSPMKNVLLDNLKLCSADCLVACAHSLGEVYIHVIIFFWLTVPLG